MSITHDDIFRLADEIDGEGAKPSILEIRRRFGSGSYSTISAALKLWQKKEGSADSDDEPELSEGVSSILSRAVGEIVRYVERQVQADVETAMLDQKKQIETLVEEKAGLLVDLDTCLHNLTLAETRAEKLATDAARSEGAAEVLRGELVRERSRAEGAIVNYDQLRVQVQAQQVALDAAQRELDLLRKPAKASSVKSAKVSAVKQSGAVQ